MEHRPNTLNDYIGGQSFCCGEKEFEPSQTGKDGFETPDYEHLIFFYHPDHLGSTALVTDNDGNVVQSVAYIPYGEVFIEERNGTWNTPYLFNGKELDEETGLYYYGARYLNPTNGMWLSTDPLFEKYVGMSPYHYCNLNPLRFVDPTGMAGWEVQESNGAMWYNENLTSENVAEGFKYFDSEESASLYSNSIKAKNWTKDKAKDFYPVATSQSTSFANDAIGGVSSSLHNVIAGKISEATADALNKTVNPKLVAGSKFLGAASTFVTFGTAGTVAVVEATKCYQGKTSFMEGSKKSGAQIGSAVGSFSGGLLGGALGGVAGASVGPVGAVVGGAAGGAYGAYVGDVVGSYFGEALGIGIGHIGELFK